MAKQLRLLLWAQCNRDCPKCCNKSYDIENLPRCMDARGYETISLTGGEPMINPRTLKTVISNLRKWADTGTRIYLYTAYVRNSTTAVSVLELLDGITVTLHDDKDVQPFIEFTERVHRHWTWKRKSLRVNVFKGVSFPAREVPDYWQVKSDIEWLDDCPLPQDEVFMRC